MLALADVAKVGSEIVASHCSEGSDVIVGCRAVHLSLGRTVRINDSAVSPERSKLIGVRRFNFWLVSWGSNYRNRQNSQVPGCNRQRYRISRLTRCIRKQRRKLYALPNLHLIVVDFFLEYIILELLQYARSDFGQVHTRIHIAQVCALGHEPLVLRRPLILGKRLQVIPWLYKKVLLCHCDLVNHLGRAWVFYVPFLERFVSPVAVSDAQVIRLDFVDVLRDCPLLVWRRVFFQVQQSTVVEPDSVSPV